MTQQEVKLDMISQKEGDVTAVAAPGVGGVGSFSSSGRNSGQVIDMMNELSEKIHQETDEKLKTVKERMLAIDNYAKEITNTHKKQIE